MILIVLFAVKTSFSRMSAPSYVRALTLVDFHMPEDDDKRNAFVHIVEHDATFAQLQYRREQIGYMVDHIRDLNQSITLGDVANFFGVKNSIINRSLAQNRANQDDEVTVGRPGELSAEEKYAIDQFIAKRFEAKNPVLYSEIKELLAQNYDHEVTSSVIYSYIHSNDKFTTVVGNPCESERVHCDTQLIDAHFLILKNKIDTFDIPPELIINIDEAGYSEWVDAHKRRCIVPSDFTSATASVPIGRSSKRTTLVGAIVADGDSLRPMVVTNRKTVDVELLYHGYKYACYLAYQPKGFINSALYLEYIDNIVIPYVEQKRKRCGLKDRQALLIYDGCSAHVSDVVIQHLHSNGIMTHQLPPHTSDQIQPLDLVIFSRAKGAQDSVSVPNDVSPMTKKYIRMLDGWRIATTRKNVVAAFRRAGILLEVDRERKLHAVIDTRYATKVRHFPPPKAALPSVGERARAQFEDLDPFGPDDFIDF